MDQKLGENRRKERNLNNILENYKWKVEENAEQGYCGKKKS